MGTRSITVFEDDERDPIASIYRHWDGYPEEAGKDILAFLKLDAEAGKTGSRVGDPSYLAARYVAFLGEHFRGDDGGTNVTDFLSVGIVPNGADWGQEYTYYVARDGTVTFTCRYGDNPDERIVLTPEMTVDPALPVE